MTDQQRKGQGAPNPGHFAAKPQAAPDTRLDAPAIISRDLEPGQERPLEGAYTDVPLENLRIARNADGTFEARGDTWIDLTVVYAESYEGFDGQSDDELDDDARERATFFLNGHRREVEAFLAEHWGATQDDATGWDNTLITFHVPLDPGTTDDEVTSAIDDHPGVGRFYGDAYTFGTTPQPLRRFIDARRADG